MGNLGIRAQSAVKWIGNNSLPAAEKNMDKNTQENPERAFSQHCAHLPVFRDDRQAATVHEYQGRSISYILPLLRRLLPNLPSQQELTGIPVSSFRAGMQKILQDLEVLFTS